MEQASKIQFGEDWQKIQVTGLCAARTPSAPRRLYASRTHNFALWNVALSTAHTMCNTPPFYASRLQFHQQFRFSH